MNARFWTRVNGDYVKITLEPNQCLEWAWSEQGEEGWSSGSEVYEHDGERVYLYSGSRSNDCDGRHDNSHSMNSRLDRLSHRIPCEEYWQGPNGEQWCVEYDPQCSSPRYNGEFIAVPDWGCEESSQRDQYAELAGY